MRTSRIILPVILIAALIGLSALPKASHAAPLYTNPGTTDLVAWWSLDETSGTRNDSHGSNHLTDNNTVGYAAGVKGNAGDFVSANSEYLSINDNANLSANGSFTTCSWVNLTEKSVNMAIVSKWGTPNFEYYLLYNAVSDIFRLTTSHDGINSVFLNASVSSPSTNTWYFICSWYNSSGPTTHLQINNGTTASRSVTGMYDGTYPFMIGAQANGAYMNGKIDETVFYKRLLSDDERTWLYNSGAGRQYCELTSCATPTFTFTPTNTLTPSPTFTFTPTFTATFTNTATDTNTPIHTATFTDTPTATDTPTDTPTPTETFTPTITFTPTVTFTPSPTRTPGNMATAFYDGTITYGDTAQVVVLSLLCLVVTIAFLAWLITTNLQKRRRK